jgi:hypothetical protein
MDEKEKRGKNKNKKQEKPKNKKRNRVEYIEEGKQTARLAIYFE